MHKTIFILCIQKGTGFLSALVEVSAIPFWLHDN